MSQMPKVLQIPIWPLKMINAYLVIDKKGAVLVDCGLPNSGRKILSFLKKSLKSLDELKYIVVTHGHVDHAGSAKYLRDKTRAQVIAHKNEAPYLMGEKKMHFCPTGPFGNLLFKTGAPLEKYISFNPDILIEGEDGFFDLFLGDKALRIMSTHGHTPGSISLVIEESGEAIVGDLLASGVGLGGIIFNGQPKRPPFEEDPESVANQLEKLSANYKGSFYLGHGGPVANKQILKHITNLRNLKNRT